MISVVMPVYDRTDILVESIESILRQTYRDFELVIVTDGSPQKTLRVLLGYASNPQVRIFDFPWRSGGPVRGRNKGIVEARGQWVAFQDSDDIAEPIRLGLSLQYAELFNADVVYGGWRAKIEGKNHAPELRDGQEIICPETTFERLKQICIQCQGTVMVRRSALLAVGGLKQRFNYEEDYELWLRLCARGYVFKAIPEVLTTLRIHDGNLEKKYKAQAAYWHRLVLEEYHVDGDLSDSKQ
jgi:O-antigen biosynthesis protein